ncbi:DUF1508 domain-containing protein [Occultella kanbiaonis]|uniref:DUF1508 domain-containing protein n=1 Tax=Occultella kanbiaonis TaxID=2675754 RepID=UPI00143DB349|nr:DUF1508 domain-containing protein [Occultella kanbiaonis]
MATRLVYKRADGRWAWNLKADNGLIIATDGGQGYENEGDARTIADAVVGGAYRDAEKLVGR